MTTYGLVVRMLARFPNGASTNRNVKSVIVAIDPNTVALAIVRHNDFPL